MGLCVNNVIFFYTFINLGRLFRKIIYFTLKMRGRKSYFLRSQVGALTCCICGNMLKETGTIRPITKMVHDSFRVHKDWEYCTNNEVLGERRLQGLF